VVSKLVAVSASESALDQYTVLVLVVHCSVVYRIMLSVIALHGTTAAYVYTHCANHGTATTYVLAKQVLPL
jgi:hypothetical protein